MRRFINICSTGLLVIILGCAGSHSMKLAPSFPINEFTQIYEVFGMDCPGCHGGVEKLINRIPGVIASEANWEQQRLWVQIDPDMSVDQDDIIKAVKEANFTAGKRIQ